MSKRTGRNIVATIPAASVATLLLCAMTLAPVASQERSAGPRPAGPTAPVADDSLGTAPVPASQLLAGAREVYTGGLLGSKHDFTESGQFGRDLCTPCHTPHIPTRQATQASGLRVVREPSEGPLRPYRTTGVSLDSASLLCLTCHDGVVASDVFSGAHASSWSKASQGGRTLGSRLTSHPVGVKYPQAQQDYHSATTVTSSGRLKLPDGRVQCTTCHDPHNTERHAGMLQMSNERSRLCLACHRL